MSQIALETLKAKFGDAVVATGSQHGDEWAEVTASSIAEVAAFLKSEPTLDFVMLTDLTAVDYLEYDPAHRLADNDPRRFAVAYHFYSLAKKHRLRVKVYRGLDDMKVPSVAHIYKCADWWERGAWDFHGIEFQGHPDLAGHGKVRRMWTYEAFVGHPLRRDYPIHKRQPLTPERHMKDLVRGPGPGPSDRHSPFSQRPGSRPNTRSDSYD